jgi:hypothetical protein
MMVELSADDTVCSADGWIYTMTVTVLPRREKTKLWGLKKKQFQEEISSIIYCHIRYHYHYWRNVIITFDQKSVNTFDIKQRPSVLDSTRY